MRWLHKAGGDQPRLCLPLVHGKTRIRPCLAQEEENLPTQGWVFQVFQLPAVLPTVEGKSNWDRGRSAGHLGRTGLGDRCRRRKCPVVSAWLTSGEKKREENRLLITRFVTILMCIPLYSCPFLKKRKKKERKPR